MNSVIQPQPDCEAMRPSVTPQMTPQMARGVEDWFRREILVHEAALLRFLARHWSNHHDLHDIRHDVYVRVLEGAETKLPHSPRAFLFGVARHLLIDRVRRDRIVAFDLLEDVDSLNVLIDEITPERRANGREQVARLSRLFDRLPDRCREVIWMRRIEDLPQKQIAQRLGIAEATVEKHLVRGIALLADAFHSNVSRVQIRKRLKHVNNPPTEAGDGE